MLGGCSSCCCYCILPSRSCLSFPSGRNWGKGKREGKSGSRSCKVSNPELGPIALPVVHQGWGCLNEEPEFQNRNLALHSASSFLALSVKAVPGKRIPHSSLAVVRDPEWLCENGLAGECLLSQDPSSFAWLFLYIQLLPFVGIT